MERKRISAISTDLSDDAVVELSGELRKLLADAFDGTKLTAQEKQDLVAFMCAL